MVIKTTGYQCADCSMKSFDRSVVGRHVASLRGQTKPFLYEVGDEPLWLDLSYLEGRMSSSWTPVAYCIRIKEQSRDERTHENKYDVELLDDIPPFPHKKGDRWWGHPEHAISREKPEIKVKQPA